MEHLYPWHAAAAKSLQSCPTLCDPVDCSPPGSSIHGIVQARTLEWAAIAFSSAWKWEVKVKSLSRARLCATPWTAAHQAPPSMGFSGQEHWSGVPLPSPNSHPSECKIAYHCHFSLRFLNGCWIIGSTVPQHYDIALNSNFCTNITDSIGWRQGGSSWKRGLKTGG